MCRNLFTRQAFRTLAVALWLPLLASSAQQSAPAHNMQQPAAQQAGANDTAQKFENFDNFLDSHPQIAKELAKNPALANDEKYLHSHPQLAQFLEAHGGVKRELSEHPGRFIEREMGKRWRQHQTRRVDIFGWLPRSQSTDRERSAERSQSSK